MFPGVLEHHYSSFLLLLYQINVILTICGYWLLQNLEKRKKNNKFNRLQIELFSLPNISPAYKIPLPSNIGPSNLSFVHIYAQFSFKKGISLRALDVAILWGHLMFLSGQEQAIFSSWGI